MAGGAGSESEVLVVGQSSRRQENPISQLGKRLKQVQSGFTAWVSTQSPPVEAAFVTLTNAAQGAVVGALLGTFSRDVSSFLPPESSSIDSQAMASFKQAQALAGGPLVQARNVAVITGVNAGLLCIMKRMRGVEDMEGRIVAGFGSGAMFSLVSGMGGPNQVTNAITSGLVFALFQAGAAKVAEKFSSPAADDINYAKTRSLLISLGFQKYEKNFKKGLLNDQTLPLLTDSSLKDVNIPPGPRLLILDQIERDPVLRSGRK